MFHLERFYILQTAQTAQVWRHPHPWITDRLCRRGIHAADRGGTVSNLSCSWSQQFTRCLCAISCRHTFCGGCCRCFESAFVREHLWTLWFDFTSLRDPVHGYVLVSKVISLKLSVRFHFSLSYFAYCHEFCRSYFNLSGSFNLIFPNPLQTLAVTPDRVFYRRVPLRHWCKRILNWTLNHLSILIGFRIIDLKLWFESLLCAGENLLSWGGKKHVFRRVLIKIYR